MTSDRQAPNLDYPRTWAAIARAVGVGIARVRAWEREGAPIYRDDNGVPFCSRAELHSWEVEQAQKRAR